MGLYVDNFYSWLNRHNAKPVSDEETMRMEAKDREFWYYNKSFVL